MTSDTKKSKAVREDPTDLRDQYYEPSLRPLVADSVQTFAQRICPDKRDAKKRILPYHVRQQGAASTCTGQALANLIDMHRIRALGNGAGRPSMVSARMLYQMGLQQERGRSTEGPQGVNSLRSVIKGFYHNGVCCDAEWPDRNDESELTAERAKAAQGITLGAYYRLNPYLNDYHAALAEADCILAAASIHAGWKAPHESGGVITVGAEGNENHAFVIVGYNDRGFLVLNSHGAEWGGYRSGEQVLPGVALWTYEDWSVRVMDAWVLRLGVPSASSFKHSFSRAGLGDFLGGGPIRAGSAPGHQLLGHFAHLDDGRHVTGGSYASTRESVARTARKIAEDPSEPVWLSLPGSLLGMNDAFQVEVNRRTTIEDEAGMYPYTLFWCNDMVESTTAVLEHLFETAVAKVGPHSKGLNDEIEAKTGGIGRAFWRDIKRAARLAGQHRHLRRTRSLCDLGSDECGRDGAAAELFDSFAASGSKLHLVADGAGVLLLEQYLLSLASGGGGRGFGKRKDAFFDAVSSLTLIAPTIEAEQFVQAFGPLVAALKEKGSDRAALWVPSYGFERKLAVSHYTRSILDLVLYGFEGADKMRTYIGMSKRRSGIERLCQPGEPLDGLAVKKITTPDHEIKPPHMRARRYHQGHVVLNKEASEQILKGAVAIKRNDEAREPSA